MVYTRSQNYIITVVGKHDIQTIKVLVVVLLFDLKGTNMWLVARARREDKTHEWIAIYGKHTYKFLFIVWNKIGCQSRSSYTSKSTNHSNERGCTWKGITTSIEVDERMNQQQIEVEEGLAKRVEDFKFMLETLRRDKSRCG